MIYTSDNWSKAPTTHERIAAFNNLTRLTIHKEGKADYRILSGTDSGGFDVGRHGCLAGAMAACRTLWPSTPAYRMTARGESVAYAPSCPLSDLESYGGFSTLSQDIESAVPYMDARLLRWHGMAATRLTGVVEIVDESGADMAAIFATESSRPWELSAIYGRVL